MRILAGVGTGEDTGLPPDGSPVKITGRIDTRSSEEIILKSISIIQNDQEYSYSGKLQCELENMKTAMITAGAVTEEEKTLKIGQQIALEGTFVLFSTATNPGLLNIYSDNMLSADFHTYNGIHKFQPGYGIIKIPAC